MPSRYSLNLARSYYLLAGLIAAGAGAFAIASAIGSALGGCAPVFSQADFVMPPTTGAIDEALPACQQYVDVLAIGIQLALGAALLLTAWFFGSRGRTARVLLTGGALLGILAGAAPLAFILWILSYYHQSPGPVEFLIGSVPLIGGLFAAWVTWRAHGRSRTDAQHLETGTTAV
jgi:hypothetical protein